MGRVPLLRGWVLQTRSDRFRRWAQRNRHTDVGAIFYEALQLIDRFHLDRRRGRLSWGDYQGLRSAVGRHPNYRNVSPTELHGAGRHLAFRL